MTKASARSDMTHEYLRAVRTYHLQYAELKRMTRTSLGAQLPARKEFVDVHERSIPSSCTLRERCRRQALDACTEFLKQNERAREEWKLEGAFAEFESKF